eukprot:m.38761 g.38761  ORF g.38761 m.38761 type:complete len:312 (-) comp12614_c0_seq2:18-953(-)
MFSKLTFLGTSAGCPTKLRNVTSHVLQFTNGKQWMLDCGEGTQQQVQRAQGVKPSRLAAILITHMHGDHIFGLPGLLASMSMAGGRDASSSPLVIVGPNGLKHYLDTCINLSQSYLDFPVDVRELDATTEHDLGTIDGVQVRAYPLKHAIPCLGYVLTEKTKQRKVDMNKAKAFGLAGPQIGELLRAGHLLKDDGTTITTTDVCLPVEPPRKVVLLGDTCNSDTILEPGRGATVVVHECTLDASMEESAIANGHSTSVMAGNFARRLQAKRLILTHISPRYDSWTLLQQEASKAAGGVEVLCADDFSEFSI